MAFESNVTQVTDQGNPQPSYRLAWRDTLGGGIPTYAARNFGVATATVVEFLSDWRVDDVGGYSQAAWGVVRDSTGNGVSVMLYRDPSNGWRLFIGTALTWASFGTQTAVKTIASGLSTGTWLRMHIKVVTNPDNTLTITATPRTTGNVDIDSLTVTLNVAKGDYCGFYGTDNQLGGTQHAWYDNINVRASGSTGFVPTEIATSYVFTFVNDLGEESAPSLPSAVVVRPDGVSATVTTATSLPTGVSTDYGITTKRIYRAATGNTGTAFLFVAEIPLAQADYVDTLTDAELGEVLQSSIWALPPDDLRGILALPNGIMVGFRRNQLCFSAQNQPHAWPIEYRLNTDTDIIGIGNIDNTVVIGTESFVYVATGNDPAAYSMSKFEVPYACMSGKSFAYLTGIGVVFAGTNGLMAVAGIGQVRNLTESVFTDTQWKALTPSSLRAVAHNDIYFMFWDTGAAQGCYAIDMKQTGFGVVPMSFHADAAYVDPLGDVMYLALDAFSEPDDASLPIPPSTPPYVDGRHIYEFEGSDTDHMTYRYRGKLWLLERPASMQIAQVRAESYANILFRLYGDGVQIDEMVITEETEFTLAQPDEAYSTVEYEVLGTSTIRVIQAAEDVSELG